MTTRVIAQMSGEDLGIYRMLQSRVNAIELHPTAYSAREIEEHYQKLWSFNASLIQQYGIDDSIEWGASVFTGNIFYEA